MKNSRKNLPDALKAVSGVVTSLTALAVISALFGAMLYYASLMISFDVTIGHFASGATVTGFCVCLAVCIILSVASGAVINRRTSITGSSSYSTAVVGPFVLLGGLLVANAVLKLREVLPTFADGEFAKEHIISLAVPLFGLIAAVYFIMISGGKKTERARALLSIAAIIWALLSTLSVYFETSRPINSPIKAILLTTSMINMLFITEDARFTMHTQKAPLYRAVCTLCVCFGIMFAVPNLVISILAAAGASSSAIFGSSEVTFAAIKFDLMDSIVSALITICAAARLLTFNACCGEYIKPKHEKEKTTSVSVTSAGMSEEE